MLNNLNTSLSHVLDVWRQQPENSNQPNPYLKIGAGNRWSWKRTYVSFNQATFTIVELNFFQRVARFVFGDHQTNFQRMMTILSTQPNLPRKFVRRMNEIWEKSYPNQSHFLIPLPPKAIKQVIVDVEPEVKDDSGKPPAPSVPSFKPTPFGSPFKPTLQLDPAFDFTKRPPAYDFTLNPFATDSFTNPPPKVSRTPTGGIVVDSSFHGGNNKVFSNQTFVNNRFIDVI